MAGRTVPSIGVDRGALSLSDSSNNNVFGILQRAAGLVAGYQDAVSGSSLLYSAVSGAAAWSVGATGKDVFAGTAGSQGASFDGSAVDVQAAASIITGITRVGIGSPPVPSVRPGMFNGVVKRARIWAMSREPNYTLPGGSR